MTQFIPVEHDPFDLADNLMRPGSRDPAGNLQKNFERNRPYIRPDAGSFNTSLPLAHEFAFRDWLKQNNVPFDANASIADYDMRGFYQALMQQNPRAQSSVNANDRQIHYPDYWKTPYHETFSAESQWATPVAPKWTTDDKLISPGGRILIDERARRAEPNLIPVDHDPFAAQ